jgi:hypothetical protein
MKTRVIAAAVTSVAAAGTLLTAAVPAQAAPGNCTITFPTSNTISSRCTSGTGHQRIDIVLSAPDPRNGQTAALGNWAAVGETSTAYFPSWHIVRYMIVLSDN